MGNWNSGRKPQPTALKILRGNPGKRRLNPNEPQPAAVDESFDTPPGELNGDAAARREWERVAPLLRLCGLVSQAERTALLALCQQWSQYLKASQAVRKAGLTLNIHKGGADIPIANPHIAIASQALTHCQRLWNELGLTPSGRARVTKVPSVLPDAPASKWAGVI